MKGYTDLEQSKKLAEFLPLESADMYYSSVPVREWKDKGDTSKGTHVVFKDKIFALENLPNCQIGEGDTYAWSLAALLGVLQNYEINNFSDSIQLSVNNKALVTEDDETLLDLVVNMIICLHELKML